MSSVAAHENRGHGSPFPPGIVASFLRVDGVVRAMPDASALHSALRDIADLADEDMSERDVENLFLEVF